MHAAEHRSFFRYCVPAVCDAFADALFFCRVLFPASYSRRLPKYVSSLAGLVIHPGISFARDRILTSYSATLATSECGNNAVVRYRVTFAGEGSRPDSTSINATLSKTDSGQAWCVR